MTKGLRRSQSEWQVIIQQQQSSGLSVVRFCQQQDLCSKTFYLYRRTILSDKNSASSSKRFIKIKKTLAAKPLQSNSTCVLHYHDCRLHFDSHTDANWLAQIMKTLS